MLRRVVNFASFLIAAALALWMRTLDYGWIASLNLAVVVWVVIVFVISTLPAAFVLGGAHRRLRRLDKIGGSAGLTDKIADAVRGLPADEQERIAKRMIDDCLK
jgi:hypothetical protein